MSRNRRRFFSVVVLFSALVIVSPGCGDPSPSTSRAEAASVAAAEREFLISFRRANVAAQDRCKAEVRPQADCIGLAAGPGESAALARFSEAIRKILSEGVGGDCAAALEEALANSLELPFFPGEATATCRADSHG